MIRVVIAEDQALVRGALVALLALEADIEVVAQAADGLAALAAIEELHPDVVVTDIEMPKKSGLDLAVDVHARGLSVRVIIVTTFARAGYLRRALDAGVAGFCSKIGPRRSSRRRYAPFMPGGASSIRSSPSTRGPAAIRSPTASAPSCGSPPTG